MNKLILTAAMMSAPVWAQSGGGAAAPGGTSTAIQVPASGRQGQGGMVATVQTPIPGVTTSVNTINSGIQVQGPWAGSTAEGALAGPLTLRDAVTRALKNNLGGIGLTSAVKQAQGQERTARSALLPNLNGSFRENYLTQDLQALGIRAPFLPTIVGPFSYFDLRATLTQNFFDLTALNNRRTAQEIVRANEFAMRDARDMIVLAAGGAYLQVVAAKARVDAERVQLQTAREINQQTLARRQQGIAAQLDLNRTQVQERTEQQRLTTLQNDLARQKINLARIAGLPPNANYDIAPGIEFSPAPGLSVEDAVKQALDARADLKAADAQLRAAERSRAAAKSERLPTLAVSADIGEIGPRFSQAEHTYTVAGALRIPIWQGGRASGDIAQAEAAVEQRRAEVADMRGRIEADVRTAFLDIEAAASQVDVAKASQDAARDTLRLTREKFETGISDSVEVTQAAAATASADLDYITALFAHNLAKLELARAMGQAEQMLPDLLRVQ
jgi:outer membrane protein TolC